MLKLGNELFSNQVFRTLSMRLYSQQGSSQTTKVTSNEPKINPDVPGLSDKCCAVPNTPVGPGAAKDKEYKNPEYFCYTVDSFAEAEVEMAKFRLPAPSNKKPFGK